MAEDLMSTQTGGYGETIQSAPEASATPDQFNVQLPNVNQSVEQVADQPPMDQPATEQPTPEQVVTDETLNENVQPTDAPAESVTEQVTTQAQETPQPQEVTQEAPTEIIQPESQVQLSGTTADGDVIMDLNQLKQQQQQQEEINPALVDSELEYDTKLTSTSDGEVVMNLGEETDEDAVNETYLASPVKLRGSRVISLKNIGDPDKPAKPKKDGYYRYAGRPDSIYHKVDGEWLKSTDGGKNYYKITAGDVDRRIAILEAEATPFATPKIKNSSVLVDRVGNLGKFNLPNQLVTAAGNPLVSKNISFNDFTKSNIGSETDRYNKDGTLNFNYKPEVARMSPENKAIYEASKKEMNDGYYTYPGREDAIYKKEGGEWYIDETNTGNNFKKLDGDIARREAQLEAIAVPNALSAILITRKPITLDTSGDVFDLIDIKNEVDGMKVAQTANQLKGAFQEGQNFVDTEIMNFAKDNLTKDQKEYLIGLQDEIKTIMGDGSYSDLKAQKIADVLSSGQQYFNDAVQINDVINKAYSAGMSVDRLNYENKKKTFAKDFDQKTMSDADQFSAKLFQDVRWMSDFVIENVDAGNLTIDPKTGAISFAEGASPAERQYIDAKLSELMKRYDGIQAQRFAEVKDKILEDKSELSDTKATIEGLKDQLAEAKRNGDLQWANSINQVIKEQQGKVSTLEKAIRDNENMSNTLFLTNPKKIINNVAGLETESSRSALDAIPKELSPKQRFDLYYENLQKKNEELAKRNGINYASLDRFDMRMKDLLDWGEFYSLSDAEKEYLKNKATINALKPLYYNNDTGYTGNTAGFWDSFMNGYAKALQPNTSAADGYQSEKEKLEIVNRHLEDKGFTSQDFVTPDALEKMKEQSVVDFWSRESLGSMSGTSGAYMQMIVLASETPGVLLKSLSTAEKLITGAKTVTQAEKYASGLVEAYDAAMSTTKLGRFLKPAIQEGINFEIAGREFNDPENQLTLLSGAAGGVFGEGFAAIAQKAGATKVGQYVANIFGDQAPAAMKTLQRVGRLAARGFGEVPQETGEELANIYMNSSNFQEMMSKASESFGTFDKIQQFVVSTLVLGVAFGVVMPNSAKEAYDSMPEDKRKQVDQVLSELKSDINKGQQAANSYAETMTQREKTKTKAEENDKENKPGVSGEERVGEKPVEEQPVTEASKEEVSPSGVVQEEQVQVEEVTPEEPSNVEEVKTPEEEIVAQTNPTLEPSESDMFNDLQSISEIKNPIDKRRAIQEFDAKYDGQYKRMSKIDANFGSIVRNLKQNNLINIDC